MKLLTEFLREKHDQKNLEDIEAEELKEHLCEFSVKRKDGKDFEPSRLRSVFSSFNRHLKECKYPVSVIEDVAFKRARRRQSTFDIEKVGFVEKLSTYFCRPFLPVCSVYFWNES